MTKKQLRELAIVEIKKGVAAARAAYPANIPADAEAVAEATLRIVPASKEPEA